MELTKTISETKLTKLFLIIENRMLREAMSTVFQKQPDFCLVDSIRYSPAAYNLWLTSNCDVLLADQASAAAFPSNFISDLLSLSPGRKAILFGMEDDPEIFLQAVRAGMSGYLLGDASAEDTFAAVRRVVAGRKRFPLRASVIIYFSWLLARHAKGSMILNQRLCHQARFKPLGSNSSLHFWPAAFSNKEIAETMRLSEFTVKNHVHRIMRRLNAPSRYAAVQTVCESSVSSTIRPA